MSAILTAIIAFLSIIVPGFFLALALLKKTKLNMLEITMIGFMFGLIFPPTLTWLESYLMNYVHAFTFSAGLYAGNVILLTILGIFLAIQQRALNLGAINLSEKEAAVAADLNYKQRLAELRARLRTLNVETEIVRKHQREEEELARRHSEERARASGLQQNEQARLESIRADEERKLIQGHEREERLLLSGNQGTRQGLSPVWYVLIFLMLLTFATRLMSIGLAPHFFEFDPYFDMQSTEFILTHGYQWLYDHSSWPTALNGTPHRIEPIVPYLESFWYQISNPPSNQINTTLLSDVSSFYPPIVAALLVFIVFMFLYHTYGEFPAIFGAALAAAMPTLITTFIAGEQLLEPWGIFTMFFFYAAYLLAVQNPKETRFAILAGIAFASSFLGAHYYTVIAGVFAIYIVLQGVTDVLKRKEELRDFYKMNLIIIGVIAVFLVFFEPYETVLANRIPGVFGIPVLVAFPLLALILIAMFDYGPSLAVKHKIIRKVELQTQLVWLAVLMIFALFLVLLTPLGKSVTGYLYISTHFTTPSIPLFMTVQEYAPTGFNFDFGAAGFGPIGISFFGVNAIVWFVLILFTILALLSVYRKSDKGSILAIAAVWPLAIAGMIEVKYLPHFGVGYIIALSLIMGEMLIVAKKGKYMIKNLLREKNMALTAVVVFCVLVVLLESLIYVDIFTAVGVPCRNLSSQGNAIGFNEFCNSVNPQWLAALSWMKQNIGPNAPRVLSWWDYGDWINWFGNSNAVLRGDNSIARLDYETAARFVLGQKDGYGPANLANFSNRVAYSKYVLFDDQLTAKWQALNFLACVNINQTSRTFAISQANGTGQPYVLGTSQCELSHAPAYLLVPLSASAVTSYCQFGKGQGQQTSALKTILLAQNTFQNQTYCTPTNFTSGPVRILDANGNKTNIELVPTTQFFAGINNLGGGQQFITFIAMYLPNGPNNTITNAPTQFYNSNYYRAFYFGSLPGFTRVYPRNWTGINYLNQSQSVVIYQVNNYTGPNPIVTQKPAWVKNNFTMPG